MSDAVAVRQEAGSARPKLITVMAERAGLDPDVFRDAVAKVAMPTGFSREEFAACLMVAHKYDLDPFTKQIYFMKTKGGTIQPIVSVDGWAHILNRHPEHDGMTFRDALDDKGKLVSITCSIRRKDRSHPIEVTEYLDECKGDSPAWKKTPARMLRHRAMMQCARYAYGIAGVMDADEFAQWQARERGPDLAVVSEVDLVQRKSSAAAKRDGDDAVFNELIASIEEATSTEMLDHVLDAHQDVIAQLPMRWDELLSDAISVKRKALSSPLPVDPAASEAA